LEQGVTDDRSREGDRSPAPATPQVFEQGYELAKAIRSEVFGIVGKAAVGAVVLLLGSLGAILWGYFEWRLPQIAGGVPKNAVMAFSKETCPEGWERLKGSGMRVIVGATEKKDDEEAHPRRLHFNEQRGSFEEYLFTKAHHDGAPLGENERRVVLPGLLALTYCEKMHE
jgi:hypothetical protein